MHYLAFRDVLFSIFDGRSHRKNKLVLILFYGIHSFGGHLYPFYSAIVVVI